MKIIRIGLASFFILTLIFSALSIGPLFADEIKAKNNNENYMIEVSADQQAFKPILNATQTTGPNSDLYYFNWYSNYRYFIRRAEIRFFDDHENPLKSTPRIVLPISLNSETEWKPSENSPSKMLFVLRVYGDDNKWDETSPQELRHLTPNNLNNDKNFIVATQTDRALYRNIHLSGLTRSVTGTTRSKYRKVIVDGVPVPTSESGYFVDEQIVPNLNGVVHVEIFDGPKLIYKAERRYNASEQKWFIVGQGDVTFSHSVSAGPASSVSGDPLSNGDHVSSRGAFYAKGVIANAYGVTASIDSGETLLKDMFSNLDRKDPTQILKRFDQNTHYPTFGDSSVITEDAPSQGRFYLRVKKDDSNFIVGNFITESQGTDLVQLDRGLFGVLLDYKSNEANVYGDRSNRILAFASSAGTITSSDELRGTGGSVYFLHHADLSVGSERVRLEVRSPDTGVVLASTPLRIDQDYEIDYFQGRITLMRPLSSYVNSADLIRSGSGNGNVPVLVARYEYTPPAGSIMGQSVGGRAEHWFGDAIRLGITGQRENSAPADQILIGNDVLLKVTNDTWFKASYGRTDGQGFSQTNSIDGGLNYTDTAASITKNNVANAWKLEGAVNESDIISNFTGRLSTFYESYEAGFSALGNITPNAMSRAGARLDQTINANNSLLASFENRVDQGIGSTTLLRGEWTGSISRDWLFKTGLRYNSTVLPISSPAAQGARLDGGLQITYSPLGSKFSSYTFGQATINHAEGRSRNNRFGLGLAASLSDTISIQAEASNGDGGWGLNVKALSRDKSGSETYIGYQLYSDLRDRGYDPQNWMLGANRGALVFGSSKKISENLTVTSEEKYGHGGSPDTLANSYGLKYAPDQNWSFGASMEKNTVYDTKPDGSLGLDRTAATSSLGYISQDLSDALAIEYRQDKQKSGTQTTWLIRDKLDLHPEPSWHVLGRVEYDFTDVFGNSLQEANYLEGIFGLAYRPVEDDRLNILARYTYLQDLGPLGQIMTNGGTEQPKQISDVVSVDINYDFFDWLTIGAKYALREGTVSVARNSDIFLDSSASLYALRADIKIRDNWDLMVEERFLKTNQVKDRRIGSLISLYRNIGNGVKVGAGYNFTSYSTDLTDQSYSTRGFFINLLSSF